MKKQIFGIALLLALVFRSEGCDPLQLSKQIAPITRQISCLGDGIKDMDPLIDILQRNNYGVHILMHLPVVAEQMPDMKKRVGVYACKQNDELKLAYSKKGNYLKQEKKFPLIAGFFADRYIALVHTIGTDAVPGAGTYDEWIMEMEGEEYTIEDRLSHRGHETVKGDTHYYNFFNTLVEFSRMQEFAELTHAFTMRNLSSNDRLYNAFIAAQHRAGGFSQDKQEALKQIEPAFTAVPVGTRIARLTVGLAGFTGFLAVCCSRDGTYSANSLQEVFMPLPLEILKNITIG